VGVEPPPRAPGLQGKSKAWKNNTGNRNNAPAWVRDLKQGKPQLLDKKGKRRLKQDDSILWVVSVLENASSTNNQGIKKTQGGEGEEDVQYGKVLPRVRISCGRERMKKTSFQHSGGKQEESFTVKEKAYGDQRATASLVHH